MKQDCRCSQCILENNNGICDRKDCCNYKSEFMKEYKQKPSDYVNMCVASYLKSSEVQENVTNTKMISAGITEAKLDAIIYMLDRISYANE